MAIACAAICRHGARVTRSSTRDGLLLGVGAYLSWGLLPLYLRLIAHVPPMQILSYRILWSLGLLGVVAVAVRRVGAIARAARGRTLLLLGCSSLLIAANWLTYIWAVQNGHVLEASLGYFVNPLVSVGLGVAVLGERLRRVQGVAIALAAAGVVVAALDGGGAAWVAGVLAVSFGLYGLVRKVAAIDALGGLLVETLLLAPVAAVLLMLAAGQGTAAWGRDGTTDLLLALAGAVTAAPLLMFAAAARRLPLSVLGLLQYLSPTIQFAEAVLIFGEPLRPVHGLTFGLIWTGCAVFAWDGVRGRGRGAE